MEIIFNLELGVSYIDVLLSSSFAILKIISWIVTGKGIILVLFRN